MNRDEIMKLIIELDEKNKRSKQENSVKVMKVGSEFEININEITKDLNIHYENYEIFKTYLKDYFKLHQKPGHIFMVIYSDAYKSIPKEKEKTMIEHFYVFEKLMQSVIGYKASESHYNFNRLSNKTVGFYCMILNYCFLKYFYLKSN